MNTKIRISIWIVALFLVFSGIGLSSRKAFAASGIANLGTAGIFDERRSAIAEFLGSLPSSGNAYLGTAGIFDERRSAIAEFLGSLP
jgi:hypothetical protein